MKRKQLIKYLRAELTRSIKYAESDQVDDLIRQHTKMVETFEKKYK